jgi:hypothetical protein
MEAREERRIARLTTQDFLEQLALVLATYHEHPTIEGLTEEEQERGQKRWDAARREQVEALFTQGTPQFKRLGLIMFDNYLESFDNSNCL